MKRTLLLILVQLAFVFGARAQRAVALKARPLARWQVGTANFSGIAPLGGGRFAVVSDKEPQDGFFVFRIDQNSQTGQVDSVSVEGFYGNPQADVDARGLSVRDCEGVAFHPQRGTVFIAGEGDQQVLEYRLNGVPTGQGLAVPAQFGPDQIQPNGGFEGLAYSPQTRRFWVATENTLRADAMPLSGRTTMQYGRLRLLCFDDDLQPVGQYAYRVDSAELSMAGTYYAHGVSALCALPDGRLVVLERELSVPAGYLGARCVCKLYAVSPSEGQAIAADTNLRLLPSERYLAKQLLLTLSSRIAFLHIDFANYEAVCPGIVLPDGRQTLLLLNDSQASAGKGPFRLRDYIQVVIL